MQRRSLFLSARTIAFRVDDATVECYRGFALDLEDASGKTHDELPVPAVFVVSRAERVRTASIAGHPPKMLTFTTTVVSLLPVRG